jgi:hypothetical protein
MKSDLDGIYLTNFGTETKYEDFTNEEQLEIARRAGYQIEEREYFIFFKKNGKVKFLGKSQEVPCKDERAKHVLFVGLRRDKRFSSGKTLDETLAEATDRELKGADHAFLNLPSYSGALAHCKWENLETEIAKFDYLERSGFTYFPLSLSNIKTMMAGKEFGKSVAFGKDGHHPDDMGGGYNEFKSEYIDYSSQRAFRNSINDCVRDGNFEMHFKRVPARRILYHFFTDALRKICHKIADSIKKRSSYLELTEEDGKPKIMSRGNYKAQEWEYQKLREAYDKMKADGIKKIHLKYRSIE